VQTGFPGGYRLPLRALAARDRAVGGNGVVHLGHPPGCRAFGGVGQGVGHRSDPGHGPALPPGGGAGPGRSCPGRRCLVRLRRLPRRRGYPARSPAPRPPPRRPGM
ncbi:MAG: hypothetical protein AVDCRST_MAG88-1649, partial [uncultured Thermomicrobiales bacterium]